MQRAGCGRFAPSPTGDLHLGNLRTALISWLLARQDGAAWIVRMEDLDPVTSSTDFARSQLADLAALGMVSDRDVVYQSQRFALYRDAIATLRAAGVVYECYCTRREIRQAATAAHPAPHGELPEGAYPGTCRRLDQASRMRLQGDGRRPALRLLSEAGSIDFTDLIGGAMSGLVDDVVLQRNDGVPAYNLAVVVDDADQGVTQVVRGDDLASSTPRQIELQRLLGLRTPQYAHVPLVLGPDGSRLAKRDGDVTLARLAARGVTAGQVLARLGASLFDSDDGGVRRSVTIDELLARFSVAQLPTTRWRLSAAELNGDDLPRSLPRSQP
ncbi:MAG: tRNA glutamyl-Q(34) synthetase GluQRS [Ilumatobacteraceae bacterium]